MADEEQPKDDLQKAVDATNLTNFDGAEISVLGKLAQASLPSSMLPISAEAEARSYRKRFQPDEKIEMDVDRRVRQGRKPVFTMACRILDPLLSLPSDHSRNVYKLNELMILCGINLSGASVLLISDPDGSVEHLCKLRGAISISHLAPGACDSLKERMDLPEDKFDVVIGMECSDNMQAAARNVLAETTIAARSCRVGGSMILQLLCPLSDVALSGACSLALHYFHDGMRIIKPESSRATNRERFMVARNCQPSTRKQYSHSSMNLWLERLKQPTLVAGNTPEHRPFHPEDGLETGLDLLERLTSIARQQQAQKALQIVRMVVTHKPLVAKAQLMALQNACANSVPLINLSQGYLSRFPVPSELEANLTSLAMLLGQ